MIAESSCGRQGQMSHGVVDSLWKERRDLSFQKQARMSWALSRQAARHDEQDGISGVEGMGNGTLSSGAARKGWANQPALLPGLRSGQAREESQRVGQPPA